MPKYLVFDAETGQIVHIHEHYDYTSGESLQCNTDDVLSLVDPELRQRRLEVTEAVLDRLSAGEVLRVDAETRAVVREPRRDP